MGRCGPGTTEMAFDFKSPEAIRWAETNAAELVTNIGAEARASIRAVIVDGQALGIAPRDQAKLIRSVVGLTERDTNAVLKRRADLIESGVSPEVAQAKVERYSAKLLKSRAEMIARTETMRASNEGQAQLWQQAKAQGFLSGREKKVWITADPCPKCAPLEGETVGMDEDFSVGQDPPLHPRCRCTIGLVMG